MTLATAVTLLLPLLVALDGDRWQSASVGGRKRLDRRRRLGAVRHPTRRDGAALWALLLLPWVMALIWWLLWRRHHHHLDADVVVAVIFGLAAVSTSLATLWVTWAAYWYSRRPDTPSSSLSLARVADQLATAVGKQWEDEAAIRRLNDPYPLPISWTAADESLSDSWDLLVRLASNGAGWPPPQESPASGPHDLAGEGKELVKVLARVPTGRLVVLGEPGAGKTMLMVRLVLDLLTRRAVGGPVPILASIASWNPRDASRDLRGWLCAQLVIDHPALAAPPAEGRAELTQAEALLAAGLILPILDGLDEIPEEVRGPAISKINTALRPGEQLVVTCRCKEYRNAVRPQDGIGVTLRGAAAVQLRPLDADTVRKYLCDDAADPVARARWDPVLTVLGTEAPAAHALSTPLMVGLARAIYTPRPGEPAGELRKPEELCDPAITDEAAVESLLFDAFIPAAYRNDRIGQWEAQDAEEWLVFLARHLERNIKGPDLAWWQLPLAPQLIEPRPWIRAIRKGMVEGLGGGGLGGMGGVAVYAAVDLYTTLFLRAVDPFYIGSAASPPATLTRDRRTAIFVGIVGGGLGGLLFGAIAGIIAGFFV